MTNVALEYRNLERLGNNAERIGGLLRNGCPACPKETCIVLRYHTGLADRNNVQLRR